MAQTVWKLQKLCVLPIFGFFGLVQGP